MNVNFTEDELRKIAVALNAVDTKAEDYEKYMEIRDKVAEIVVEMVRSGHERAELFY